ncbi:CDP-glycerol glycerophosphotransferase family protein [Actinomadura parmotrematis]|uniref:CDP-glycerol glycerophosphotransferase family protein n=1 Tax=Actinomadura parmotrematis TaxID=2864039 RepID=A0ABS7G3V9_9ACTN|nr:CDP-glycerol glycerophosphotransferase family protein [Actinomadura parmotrematis]MBW8487394.1 CDP-glycerol glycerophosphotransferase family protein [Actinomadura parmotrematis]
MTPKVSLVVSPAAGERALDALAYSLTGAYTVGDGVEAVTGAAAAAGEYLFFADEPMIFLPGGLENLVASLDETGSDFALGPVGTLRGNAAERAHKRLYEKPLKCVSVHDHDLLLGDGSPAGKLWRRRFLTGHGLTWEAGGPDTDVPPMLRAHCLATGVDVVTGPVCLRRPAEEDAAPAREPGAALRELEGRAVRALAGAEFLDRLPALRDEWDRRALTGGLKDVFALVAAGDDDTAARAIAAAGSYARTVGPHVLDRLPVLTRLKWHLVRRDMPAELREVLADERPPHRKGRGRVLRRGGRFYHAGYPLFEDPAVPPEIHRLHDELAVRHTVTAARWEDGRLAVEGTAMIRGLRPRRRWQQWTLAWLVCAETGRRVRLPVTATPVQGPRADWSGFRFTADPARLPAGAGRRGWLVELCVFGQGVLRTARLKAPDPLEEPAPRRAAGGTWTRAERTASGLLALFADHAPVDLTAHRRDGDELEITGRHPGGVPADARLALVLDPGGPRRPLPFTRTGGDGFTARVPLALLREGAPPPYPPGGAEDRALDDGATWRPVLTAGGADRELRLTAGPGRHPGGDAGDLVVWAQPDGRARLRWCPDAAVVRDAAPAGAGLRLAGTLPAALPDGPAELVLRPHRGGRDRRFPMRRTGDSFTAEFDPAAVASLAGTLPLPWGAYDLCAAAGDALVPLRLDAAPLGPPPPEWEAAGRTFALRRAPGDRVRLAVSTDHPEAERTAAARRALVEERYPLLRAEPLRDAVLFDSYFGRQYSDSPRAILEELRRMDAPLDLLWAVQDGQVAVPDGVTPVRRLGGEHMEALARSRYVVTNTHLPMWFRRREGQRVLQTWHGATLKRIGFDVDAANVPFVSDGYRAEMAEAIAQWDHLVSPSPWCTPILRKAFRYEGEILETGYPRNDVFHAPDRDERADRARAALGLPPGKKVVLYAPTWRDDRFHGRGRWRLDLRLDLAAARRSLGADHVLLVRCHSNVVDPVPGAGDGFVFDATDYPEMQELLLVTDVLITDYSSVMFDFAATGRPMLFFTYDLEHYRDRVRGFYLDLEAEAPGPLLRTSDDVIDAVRDIDRVAARYRDAHAAFAARACPLDDGKATLRVVERVFDL